MPDMSWMSPKRRRTTGNLKADTANGRDVTATLQVEAPPLPAKAPVNRPSPGRRLVSQPSVRFARSRPVDDGTARLEACFEKMTEALERSMEFSRQLLAEKEIRPPEASLSDQLKALDSSLSGIVHLLERVLEAQQNTCDAVETRTGRRVDLSPLVEHLDGIKEAIVRSSEERPMKLTPIVERLDSIQEALQQPNSKVSKYENANCMLESLASHLSKLQATNEQNANVIKKMQEMQSATSDSVRQLAETMKTAQARHDKQIRALTTSQTEMTNVMRDLAQAITAQNRDSCDHIVLPPPRKVGRKIVGFVYDAKEQGGK